MQFDKNQKYFSAIILAAGKSSRMGIPKLSLKYDEENSFIEHIVNDYQNFACKEIVIVVNDIGNDYLNKSKIRFLDNVKVVINKHPDWHRFYSLKIGAKSLSKIKSTFIHNVDNPFVKYEVLNKLLDYQEKADYLSPEYAGNGGHPILISKKIISDISNTKEDQIHLKKFLNQYLRLRIKVDDEKVLTNINTLEDYSRHFK